MLQREQLRRLLPTSIHLYRACKAIKKIICRNNSGALAAAGTAITMLAACASLPDIRYLDSSIRHVMAPTIMDNSGSLSVPDAESLLAERVGNAGQQIRRLAAAEEQATGRPLIKGNRIKLLSDGPQTMAAMMEAIQAAADHINLETYIFDQDELGQKFAQLLIARQRAGVQVNIIYDSVGTLGTPASFFARMRDAGIRLTEYNPVNPLKRFGRWRLNNRDHRKILVVDGKIAFTGGINISKEYSSSPPFRSPSRSTNVAGWRDTHIQLEGPAVAALQSLFLATWAEQNGMMLQDRNYFPPLKESGNELVRVIPSDPKGDYAVYKAYALAMRNASQSIHITVAYFVPDQQIVDSLTQAARRGLDVKLIFPSISDARVVFHAGRSYYQELLDAGVRIYELQETVLHAKTAVIDGVWSTVGSANLDMRSFLHNSEINIVVLGEQFGETMEQAFQRDLRNSGEITRESWARRPMSDRIKEWAARNLAYWL